MSFPKIYRETFISNIFEKFRMSEAFSGQRSAAGILKRLKCIFITDFKKRQGNDMINLVSSKVTHVGEIMIGFTNYDVTQYI